MGNLQIKTAFLLLLVICTSGFLSNSEEIESASEDFNNYLLNATRNYTTWLAENKLDPSPPISEALTLTSLSSALIVLNCQLTQQQVSGHSSNQRQAFGSESAPNLQFVGISRIQEQPYQLRGNFKCTGKMNSPTEENYCFQGEGTYQINTSRVQQAVVYQNLGITDNYYFNFTLASTDIAYLPSFDSEFYVGLWNDSRITAPVANTITKEITGLYRRSLIYNNGDSRLHPANLLLLNFLRNVTQNLDLTTVIKEEELPDPYKPTPKPPTAYRQTKTLLQKLQNYTAQ